MKKRIGNKGETLMESLVSIILYALFMTVITGMINISLRITNSSTAGADIIQQGINPVILSDYGEDYDKWKIFFTDKNKKYISTRHYVRLNKNQGLVAFTPQEEE